MDVDFRLEAEVVHVDGHQLRAAKGAGEADKDTAEAVALGVRKEGQPGMKDAR